MGPNTAHVVSTLLMLRRSLAFAVREEDFLPILSSALLLVALGRIRAALRLAEALHRAVPAARHGILVEVLRRLAVAFLAVRTTPEAESASRRPEP